MPDEKDQVIIQNNDGPSVEADDEGNLGGIDWEDLETAPYLTASHLTQIKDAFENSPDDQTTARLHARLNTIKMRTTPPDARFPNVNQTRACWQNYIDYWKCVRLTSPSRSFDDEEGAAAWCKGFWRAAQITCFSSTIERWEQARQDGISPHIDYIEQDIREREKAAMQPQSDKPFWWPF